MGRETFKAGRKILSRNLKKKLNLIFEIILFLN